MDFSISSVIVLIENLILFYLIINISMKFTIDISTTHCANALIIREKLKIIKWWKNSLQDSCDWWFLL